MGVYLSYDSSHLMDGSGAQVQRLFAIYSLSRLLKVKYLHSKIVKIDFNPGDGIHTYEEMEKYLQKLNTSLGFLETTEVEGSIEVKFRFRMINFSSRLKLLYFLYYFIYFLGLRAYANILGKKYVLLIHNPYPLIDRIPNTYKYVQKKFPNPTRHNPRDVISIQLHLVRAKVNAVNLKSRYTCDDWYLQILDEILPFFEKKALEYEILLHTDVSANGIWQIPSGISPGTLEYWKNNGVKFDEKYLKIATDDVLEKFKKYRNVKIITGVDSVEAWNLISHADLFLMGKSSFSFVGALYNLKGIIVTTKFWHSTPSYWYRIDEDFSLNVKNQCSLIARKLSNL